MTRQSAVQEHYRALAESYNGRANATCEAFYRRLAQRALGGTASPWLELGGGSGDLLDQTLGDRPGLAVACDLSEAMLRARPGAGGKSRGLVVAAGERLPFASGRFGGVLCVNVLEHVADVDQVLAEASRVLRPGGLFLAVTPNGDWEALLDLAERRGWKIPEGPHVFLGTRRLAEAARSHFTIREHRTMLTLPAGGPTFARLVDCLSFSRYLGWGFFQYLLAIKNS